MNTYLYANGNPLSYADEFGLLADGSMAEACYGQPQSTCDYLRREAQRPSCFDFNYFANDIRENRFDLLAVLGTLGVDLAIGTMPKVPAELRGLGVPKAELNPITGQLSRWSGRTGIRALRIFGRSSAGVFLGGLATSAVIFEGFYDLTVIAKAGINATTSGDCECRN